MNTKILFYTAIALSILLSCYAPAYADDTMDNGDIQPITQTIATADNMQMIDINQADALALSAIKGIGFKKAQAIVAYRQLHGDFTDIQQITLVKGIGPKMLLRIKDRITVKQLSSKQS